MKFELEPYNRGRSDEELLADLRAVARERGTDSLTRTQYEEHGRFSGATIAKRLGGWNNALRKAGLTPALEQSVTREALVADIRRVALALGVNKLFHAEYKRHGNYSQGVIHRLFGKKWDNAAKAAGLEPGWNTQITDEELFENLETVWRQLGRQPRMREVISPLSKYSGDTYKDRFGGWRNALVAFVATVNEKPAQLRNHDPPPSLAVAAARSDAYRHKTARTPSWRVRFLTLRRDGFRCKACGRSPANQPGVELQVDHIIAWTDGGETELQNLQTLCEKCNGGKSNLSFLHK